MKIQQLQITDEHTISISNRIKLKMADSILSDFADRLHANLRVKLDELKQKILTINQLKNDVEKIKSQLLLIQLEYRKEKLISEILTHWDSCQIEQKNNPSLLQIDQFSTYDISELEKISATLKK